MVDYLDDNCSIVMENAEVSLHAFVFHCFSVLVASKKWLDSFLLHSLLFLCVPILLLRRRQVLALILHNLGYFSNCLAFPIIRIWQP